MRIASIAVLIVNYKTADLAINAVQSVLSHNHAGRDVYVHIVDNASPDDSASLLLAAHDEHGWEGAVTLHLEAENHGFGRGNNVVLHQLARQSIPPDAVFFLNPDAFLNSEAIDILACALEEDAKAGFAGAGISNPDGAPVSAAFRFPSVASEFSTNFGFSPVSRLLARWEVPLKPDTPAGPVDWVAGAAFLGRMQALTDIGFFDSGFFLYYEEVDMMQRAACQGWYCLYVPQAQVVHSEGAATGVQSGRVIVSRLPDYRYQSWAYYFRKTHGRPVALLAALACVVGSACNRLLGRIRHRSSHIPPFFFRDFWRHAVRPLLFGAPSK